jgi:hypothetical protein
LARLAVGVDRPRISPFPAAPFEDGITDRTHRRFRRLALCFIRVMNALVNQAIHAVESAILTSWGHSIYLVQRPGAVLILVHEQHRQMSSAPRGKPSSIIHHGSASGSQVGRCQNPPDSGPKSTTIRLLKKRQFLPEQLDRLVWTLKTFYESQNPTEEVATWGRMAAMVRRLVGFVLRHRRIGRR